MDKKKKQGKKTRMRLGRVGVKNGKKFHGFTKRVKKGSGKKISQGT